MKKRTLAIDPGDVKTGAAISDELGITAQPAGVWKRGGFKDDLAGIKKLMTEYEIERIVIGHPINMDGSVGERAKKVESLAKKLEKALPEIEVVLWDERLTTVMAERTLIEADVSRKKRRKVIDQMAAQLILSSWLDARPAR